MRYISNDAAAVRGHIVAALKIDRQARDLTAISELVNEPLSRVAYNVLVLESEGRLRRLSDSERPRYELAT